MQDKPFDWLEIARRLKAISQAGKFFAKNEYELNRHEELERICGEIFEKYTDLNAAEAVGILQADSGYPTPKVDARGVVFKDNKILMVKEIADGGWTLPGGWCDCGMTVSENVVREVWEESGYEVKVTRLLAVYDRDTQGHTPPYPFNIYKLFFQCELTGGEAKSSNETSDVAWFAENELPEKLSKGRTLPHELTLFFEQYRDPTIPAAFD